MLSAKQIKVLANEIGNEYLAQSLSNIINQDNIVDVLSKITKIDYTDIVKIIRKLRIGDENGRRT